MKTQGRTLGCPFNLLPPRTVAGWLLSVRPIQVWNGLRPSLAYEGQTVSGRAHIWRSRCGSVRPMRAKLGLRPSLRLTLRPGSQAGPIPYPRWQEAARSSGVVSAHSSQAGTPAQGRPTQGLAGTDPRNGHLRQVSLQLLFTPEARWLRVRVASYAATSALFWPRSVVCCALLRVGQCTSDFVWDSLRLCLPACSSQAQCWLQFCLRPTPQATLAGIADRSRT